MYQTIAIAGTFDRLHKGHRYFISEAFKLGARVLIGLTSDEMTRVKTQNPKSEIRINTKIQNFQIRKRELEEYLRQEGLLERGEIIKIEDVYGPAISLAGAVHGRLEALVVTQETLKGAVEVNRKRKELGLKLLKVLTVPMILAEDNERISSTRIRLGEIDRWGRVYISKIKNQKSKIDERIRQELKKPLGILVKGNLEKLYGLAKELKKAVGKTNSSIISTVGDEVTKLCIEAGIEIQLAIVDLKVNRIPKYDSIKELGIGSDEIKIQKVSNPPGNISSGLVTAVREAYIEIIKDGKQRVIQVDGEEDLAGVPAVLLAPLGSVVLYGQPGEGVVVVEVVEEIKQKLLELIQEYQNL